MRKQSQVKRNIALSKFDTSKFKKYSGWTSGELTLANKITNSSWLKQQLTTANRTVENSWGQLELINGDFRPDFLIFLDDALFVLEVKDGNINSDETLPWEDENAWKQCRKYISEIEYKIKDLLPVIGIIVLSNVNSKNDLANQIRVQAVKKHDMDTWFHDELDKKQLRTLFKETRKRINYETQSKSNNNALCALSLLVPENFTQKVEKCNPEISLESLEQSQIPYALSLAHDGDRILYGAAGSGKTIILIKKALQLAKIYSHLKGWKILVVCYNKPLQNYLYSQLSSYDIEVRTMHGWYKMMFNR
ncbi:MAG: hypothetical protein HeimC2_11590 [Candidatus Heimdallarchaeota archaeon LC_2]|nr:MAG: hypothetical protein HeimC2_11590 [Candidatus Heimdallarchaeota archaeon LC_2]